jgi:16S rRNA (adenine1518-N6/adenine1519-N6)-dimethyltransferase
MKREFILKNLPDFNSPAAISAFLSEKKLSPQKKFGQNFLARSWAREKLADALSPPQNASVWEIGAGIGAMTAALLGRGARVTAFEIDRGFCAVLAELFSGLDTFSLVEGDVLETWKGTERGEFLLGNLPYNIASRILGCFIENGVFFKRMAVTVQREVARRMAARPASPDYSSFSILCSSVYTVKTVAAFNRDCFYPVPNVDSEGLCLELKDPADRGGYTPFFYRMVRALFASRRKTVKNNLIAFAGNEAVKTGLPLNTLCERFLRDALIRPDERAENLGCEDFLRLASVLSAAVTQKKGLAFASPALRQPKV